MLYVEGKDDQAVVNSLCNYHRIPDQFGVETAGGDAQLMLTLPVQLRSREVVRLGIVIDADTDADARWRAIRDVLLNEGYADLPTGIPGTGLVLRPHASLPRFGAWIMPDNSAPGALEDFAASLIPAGDQLWKRAGDAIDTVPEDERRFPPVRRSKAHIHTWLAWQEYPGSPMGQAITKGDLDANAPPAEAFVAWLKRLFIDEPTA